MVELNFPKFETVSEDPFALLRDGQNALQLSFLCGILMSVHPSEIPLKWLSFLVVQAFLFLRLRAYDHRVALHMVPPSSEGGSSTGLK